MAEGFHFCGLGYNAQSYISFFSIYVSLISLYLSLRVDNFSCLIFFFKEIHCLEDHVSNLEDTFLKFIYFHSILTQFIHIFLKYNL